MNKIMVGVIIIFILTVFLISLLLFQNKSNTLDQYLKELKTLNIDTSDYQKQNSFINQLSGKNKQLEEEIKTLISKTKTQNEKIEIERSIYKTKLNNILIKYKDNVINRQDLNELESELERYIQSQPNFVNPLWTKDISYLEQLVESMSTEELVSQVLVVGINGVQIDGNYLQQLIDFKAGGYILMGSNINNNEQVIELTKNLQKTNLNIPSLITTDQEGGEVNRIFWDQTSSVFEWKNKNNEQLCIEGNKRAKLMTSLGINNVLAPVLDLTNAQSGAFINNRTISSDPQVVSDKAIGYLSCFNQYNTGTLKHFPGHGMVTGDSHKIIPENNDIDYEQWFDSHGKPFADNLNNGLILSAHIKINKIDKEVVSMSKFWLQDVLRTKLNYQGLVITDDMNQYKNISGNNMSESAIKALEAGNDLLLYVPSFDSLSIIKQNLINHFEQKKEILKSKVRRILLFKSRL
jgi:beta-N-acetylhexosaminidase